MRLSLCLDTWVTSRPNPLIQLYINDIDAISKEFGIPVDETA